MAESITNYNKFNFKDSVEWQNYLKNIYPIPGYDKLEKIKKKWYKANIDQNFDVQSTTDNQSTSSNEQPQQSQPQPQQQPQQQSSQNNEPKPAQQSSQEQTNQQSSTNSNRSSNNSAQSGSSQINNKSQLFYHIEGVLKIIFFVGLIMMPGFITKYLTAIICIMAIIRNIGIPKFSKEYAFKVFASEFFSNLFYLVAISMPPGKNSLLYFMPPGIHFLSGASEYIITTNHSLLKFEKIKKLTTFVKQNRSYMIIAKQKVEIYLFFYSIIGMFFGASSLFQLILMLQYISLKNKFNVNMQQGQYEFKYQITQFSQNPKFPTIISTIIQKLLYGYDKILNFM